MTPAAAVNRSSPSVAMTIGTPLCEAKISTSLAMSSPAEPVMPAAHTNVRGSADRSMCFLSDDSSHEIDRYVSSEHLTRISSAAIRLRADPTTAQDLRSGAYSSGQRRDLLFAVQHLLQRVGKHQQRR
jgi:hypothetical protein